MAVKSGSFFVTKAAQAMSGESLQVVILALAAMHKEQGLGLLVLVSLG